MIVVQLLSHVWLFVTLWTATRQAPLSSSISGSLFKFMSIESEMLSNHLILCRPLLILPLIFPSIRFSSNELALHVKRPKYWSFSCSISPSINIQSWFSLGFTGLISLLSKGLSRVFSNTTVQKQFFSTQPSLWSNYYIHTWLLKKPYIWLWICVCKVLSLLSHTLSRLVIAFLPRSKHLLIS